MRYGTRRYYSGHINRAPYYSNMAQRECLDDFFWALFRMLGHWHDKQSWWHHNSNQEMVRHARDSLMFLEYLCESTNHRGYVTREHSWYGWHVRAGMENPTNPLNITAEFIPLIQR